VREAGASGGGAKRKVRMGRIASWRASASGVSCSV
jgi:hypothetical protein